MKFYGKAETAAKQILEAFKRPNDLPAAFAPVFINRKDNVPCRQWSWNNQLLAALAGHSDARGYRQWQSVGRNVKKGEKSFQILVPLTKKYERENAKGETETAFALYGFKSAAVFGYSQTEGDELPKEDTEVTDWLESLPLADVAESWNLSVEAYNGRPLGAHGKYRLGRSIALGVKNLSVWCHEMVHAADDRVGNLKERGQHWRSETVAELGGAILLRILGYEDDADLGGCWEYLNAYAKAAGIEPLAACQDVLKRTCDAVSLILDTAESLTTETVAA